VERKFSTAFGIPELKHDPYLHGAGVHMHPRNGRLGMHLDYEKHPQLQMQRRLNLIYYLNEEWKEEWNGDTQLWSNGLQACVKRLFPRGNRAILFTTHDESWHGVPELIKCPTGVYRQTIAFYYLSPLIDPADSSRFGAVDNGHRTKAAFKKRPQDPSDERMEKLFKLRPQRRITDADMLDIWSEWDVDSGDDKAPCLHLAEGSERCKSD